MDTRESVTEGEWIWVNQTTNVKEKKGAGKYESRNSKALNFSLPVNVWWWPGGPDPVVAHWVAGYGKIHLGLRLIA